MAEKVNLQKKIQEYRQTNPKLKNLSDEKILSILVKNGDIVLTAEQKRSLFSVKNAQNDNMGLKLERTTPKSNSEKTIYLQSGRKVIYTKTANGKLALKYYGTDGTLLNPDYFKKVEGQISISADGNSYTITKNGKKTTLQAKDPSKGAIDQNLARLNNEEKRLKKTKKDQGFIGSSWDWVKNKTGIGDGSDKAQQQIEAERKLLTQIKTGKISKKDFKEVTGVEYSKENLEKFKRGELSQASAKINGYKEGQEMASDVAGDMISGIAAVGIYTAAVAAAPFTGGASIAVGIASATASGALIKAGVKALDTVGTDRKYTLKDFGHDCATGAFSGALAPITGGLGGAVGKTVATKLGIQAVKQVGKEVAEEVVEQGVKQGVKQGLKTALTNPTGYEYVGGTLVKRGTALAAEMATDGALGGAIDGGFRAGLDSNWDTETMLDGAIEGGIGGALASPLIGGGFKVAGKGAQKVFDKEKRDLIDFIGKNLFNKNKKFFEDPQNYSIIYSIYKNNSDIQRTHINEMINELKYLHNKDVKNLLYVLSKNSSQIKELFHLIPFLKEEFATSEIVINDKLINSIVNLKKTVGYEDSLFSFIKLKLDMFNTNSFDILQNYNNRYLTLSKNLNKISSKELFNEIYTLIKDIEFNNQNFNKNELIKIFSTINYKNSEIKGDNKIFLQADKKLFQTYIELLKTIPQKNNEKLSDYFHRINELRISNEKQLSSKNTKIRIANNKSKIESNYTKDEVSLDKIDLTEEESLKFEKHKSYYIRKAGDPGTQPGMGNSDYFYSEDKLLAKGLQTYERYNSTQYFAEHPKKCPYVEGYKYPPVIRFLSTSSRGARYKTTSDIVNSFPEIGGTYQANALKCCFTTPIGSNENLIIPHVIVEIHPKSEISKAHYVAGWGNEVRYGGNTHFIVIDKYCEVIERNIGDGFKREVLGHVILQEL